MKNKLILLIFSIFLVSTILAEGIVITPTNQEIEIQIGNTQSHSMTIFNNYSFDIYDLKFPELEAKGFIFPQIDITKNSSKQINYEVKTTESFFGQLTSKVQFSFPIDLPEEITTYQIEIKETGFNPTYKTIRQGDSIQWINKDSITHDLYSTQFNTISIEPNQSSSFAFNSLGIFSYYDLDFNIYNQFNGQIEVVNRTSEQKAHNPNYDSSYTLTLNSYSEPTTLTVINSNTEYEIKYSNSKKGLITITNTGTKTAEKIKLSSDSNWITFNQNNFDINAGNPAGIEYTITPYLNNTNQTNQTYEVKIRIKGFNTEEKNITLNVFIPFHEISTDISSDFDYAMWLLNIFCPSHPCSVQCSPELPECQDNCNGVNGSSTLTANVSTLDLLDYMRGQKSLEQKVDRLLNNEKIFQDTFGMSIEQALNLTNSSLDLQIENKKSISVTRRSIFITGFFLVLIGCSLFIFIKVNKKSKDKSRVLDIHKYSGEL